MNENIEQEFTINKEKIKQDYKNNTENLVSNQELSGDNSKPYASPEKRIDELKAIRDGIKTATDDEERARLVRQALLNNDLLTKEGERDLENVTPREVHKGEEVYTETPSLNENGEVYSIRK